MQRRATTTHPRRTARPSSDEDAITMLMEDHKKVQKLFREFEKADENDDQDSRQQIAERACAELEIHAALEEELFYPAARDALDKGEWLIDEAEVEHRSAKDLIAQLRDMDPADQKYCATFKVLAEYVKHHVKEEESEMFPELRKAKLDVDRLGQDMRSRHMQLMDEMGQSEAHSAEADAEDESKEEEEKGRSRARSRTRVPG